MAPVNWRLAGPEIAFIVEDCQAPVLFVGPEFIDQVGSISAAAAERRRLSSPPKAAAPAGRISRPGATRQTGEDPQRRDQPAGHRDAALHLRHHRQAQGRDAVARQFPQPGRDRPRPEARLEQLERGRRLAGGDAGLPHRRLRLGRDRPLSRRQGRDRPRIRSRPRCWISSSTTGISKLFMVPAAMQFVVRQPARPRGGFLAAEIHALRRLARFRLRC